MVEAVPHPLQPTFAKWLRRAQGLPPQAEEDRSSGVCPRLRGKWLRGVSRCRRWGAVAPHDNLLQFSSRIYAASAQHAVMRDTNTKSQLFAKTLRREMTRAEVILWTHLRRHAINGLRFRRQHPIGPYIADFACFSVKLIVEVDGATHWTDEAQAYDQRRRAYLERLGWRELRVSNLEVCSSLDRVLEYIAAGAPPQPPIVCSA